VRVRHHARERERRRTIRERTQRPAICARHVAADAAAIALAHVQHAERKPEPAEQHVADDGGYHMREVGIAILALVIYAGMIVHGFFAECLTRAPTLVVDNRNLVKRVVFPLHLLPWSVLLVAAFQYLIGLALIAVAILATTGSLPATIVALPLLWVPQLFMALGIAYAFAALGVYLRDLSQVAGFLALVLLFLSPVFYPVSAVPAQWRFVIAANPLASIIEATRGALIYRTWPDAGTLVFLWAIGLTPDVGGLIALAILGIGIFAEMAQRRSAGADR